MSSFITNRSKLQQRNSPPEMRRVLFGDGEPTGGGFPLGSSDLLNGNEEPLMGGPDLPTTSSAAPLFQPSLPFASPSKEDPLAGAVLGVSDIITRLAIIHPCRVMRRQCQVHQGARFLHLTPFTLVPVAFNMAAQHGVSTFWRGSLGCGVVWGMSAVAEVVLSDLFGLPRSVIVDGDYMKYWKHILLKAATSALMTPFRISSFIETIRSGRGLAGSEDNRALEVIVKGLDRMRYFVFGSRDVSRKLSLLHLAVPTVLFETTHYLVLRFIYRRLFNIAKDYVSKKSACEKTKLHEFLPQIFAQMSSVVLTDLILYPAETVLHRLYVQGTRTLIDDMDTGVLAVSMKVKYEGVLDCFRSVVRTEGVGALYAGAGAVVLEWLLQMLLHQALRACFQKGSEMMKLAASASPALPSHPPSRPLLVSPSRQIPSTSLHSAPINRPNDFPSFGELSSSDPLAHFQSALAQRPPLSYKSADPFSPGFSSR